MLDAVKGYKSYLVAILTAAVVVAHSMGYIDDATRDTLLGLLGAGAIGTVSAKINRMDKKVPVILFLLLIPSILNAQTIVVGPVTTSNKLVWTASPNSGTVANAQALEYRVRIDNGAFLVVPNVACVSLNNDGCTAPLTAPMVTLLNVIGQHSVTLSAYSNIVGLESAESIPFVLKSAAAAPTGLKIIQ